MNFIKIVKISMSLFILSSCSFYKGSISTSTVSPNASYEDIAIGVSQTFKLIGIGGTSRDALVFEAKKQLYNNRPLGKSEMYVNFTVDFKETIVFFYTQTKVTVTADVIKNNTNIPDSIYSEKYKKKISQGILITDLFHIGDSVVTTKKKELVIISIEKPNKVRVEYKTKKGKFKTKKKSINKIYTNLASFNGLNIGDEINDSEGKSIVIYVGFKKYICINKIGIIWSSTY